MILTTLCAPLSALYVCGASAVFIPLAVVGCLLVYIFTEVKPGVVGTADITATAVATVMVVAYFVLALAMIWWRNLESYFSEMPWNAVASTTQEKVGERVYQKRCPFTGRRPAYRCPSCQCRVHEEAFHLADRRATITLGETVLRWDLASAAAEAEGDNLERARSALDEALDLRGNVYSLGVTACCIGCATWQKCFNLAPRLALSFALAALFYAYIPWAFASFLELIGTAGAVVKGVTGCVAVALACAALLVQARALGRANTFMSWHKGEVPALRPLFEVAQRGAGAAIARAAFSTKWDPLM